ncbi:hypothetical protein [Streptomyces sp. NBC_01465]|uniref:hypothetical protein n=1 Tax=Streptomyces sp. NBC_01465 TaxID=2903878 RepID=UPI002E333CFF|nr:hypothetical protein [Streptomyces sp. NBC_01465]
MTPTVEERLQEALAARAARVTYGGLRRDAPPQGRSWGMRRVRIAAFAALGAVAAAAAVCLLVLPGGPLDPAPVPPARTPGVSEPPSPTPPVGPSSKSPRVIVSP